MFYVYLLRSVDHPGQVYTGSTNDLKARLASHNRGENRHTSKYAPWELKCYIAFQVEAAARAFEKYLKSGSGQAFANKRLRQPQGPWPKHATSDMPA